MKVFVIASLIAAIAGPVCSFGTTDDPGFARYQVILDKMPFGKPPPPRLDKPPPAPPKQTGPSWVESYRMTMLMVDEEEQPRIGLINVKDKYSFTLGMSDDPIDGIRLKSVDYAKQSAMVEKGGDEKEIKMQELSAAPVAQPAAPPKSTATSIRDKYRQRQEAMRKPKPPPAEPKFTGQELENHLREYQMEVLRKGLPPLPVPLTPEMDNKLVEEGVLPPLDQQGPPSP